MAFLLPYTHPILSSIWIFQKAWVRSLVAISDFVRPPGPQSSWTRDEYNAYRRWKYATDAEYRQKMICNSLEYYKARYTNDPGWRQARLKREADRYANDPVFRQTKLRREVERRANPEYREASLQRLRDRYASDSAFRQAKLQQAIDRYANKPGYREALLQRRKERYANDAEY